MSSAPSKVAQTLHQIEGTSGGQVTRINEMAAITEDVVEAAAQTLVIGNAN
ncbi:hypothetical protein [Roseinatronobacter alkalisoli]|uniref:Methyl-accepting chemotaxis protein n=1 Tax=Roseinatronobacter alkalisoli TaxID=3028235 RepID=A0ABT5TFN6_9RHOB|nr:hypothetical protein [Roseinatronobacter sp. HJB301]MDD7973759.1 hypothetical protein [Roseinatronobacter sp. HJB301]